MKQKPNKNVSYTKQGLIVLTGAFERLIRNIKFFKLFLLRKFVEYYGDKIKWRNGGR